MDGDRTWIGHTEMAITDVQKVLDNVLWRIGPIYEEQVVVSYSIGDKLSPVILCLVESDYPLDVPLFEYIAVLLRSKTRSLSGLSFVNRPHKCCKFARNDPVDIAIVNSLIVLIFLHIEGLEIIPLMLNALLETLKTVQNSALVVTLPL